VTAATEPPRFGAAEVIQIASKLTADDPTFVVGGQATNLWAWYYRDREPALQSGEPLTSQDIDCFGTFEAARRFAEAVGGEVRRPGPDDMNKPLVIDFLKDILEVTRRELRRGVSVIGVTAMIDGAEQEAEIPVLHPMLCLKSRIANMLHSATRRRDLLAWQQLHAAIAILRRHVDEALEDGDWPEAKDCFASLYAYLRFDQLGRRAQVELGIDLIGIMRHFRADDRIDPRYREHQLAGIILRLEKRLAAANMMAQITQDSPNPIRSTLA
jgi:hypothetical protein